MVLTAGATLCFGGVAAAAVHTAATTTARRHDTTRRRRWSPPSDSVTLPLFGASLTVDVSTDPAGQIASVDLSPADGFTAVTDRPRNVSFVNDAGTAKVRVQARHGGQSVSARGTTLADISGPGSWSGDPFGTGSTVTVSLHVGAAADGGPDITGVTSTDPSATSVRRSTAPALEQRRPRRCHFSSGGQQRTLSITATVVQSDETSRASVGVSLSAIRGVAQDPAVAAGAKTWTGMLCDGSTAQINYTVAENGTLSAVSATPSDAEVKTNDKSADVRFTTGERVRIRVRTNDDDQIKVDARAEVPLRHHRSDGEHADEHDGRRPR